MVDPVSRDGPNPTARTRGGPRAGLRVRDGLVLLAVAAWVALILGNFAAPPPTPPAVPYATVAAHHGAGPH